MTDDVTRILRDAYDRRVEERAMRPAPTWETAERDIFLEVLQQERIATLLELGAATGSDAAFFKAHGFDVVCIDLSPQFIAYTAPKESGGRRRSATFITWAQLIGRWQESKSGSLSKGYGTEFDFDPDSNFDPDEAMRPRERAWS